MEMTRRDAQRLRDVFKKAPKSGKEIPEVTVNGDDLQIVLVPETGQTGLLIPYNEDGDQVFLELDNPTLKRLRVECKEAVTIMRRAGAGEKNTGYRDNLHGWV